MDQTAYFEQMRQKRRSEILETARQLIMEQGLASFSMQGLAQTLDISTVTLYKYYKNSIAVMEDLYQLTASSLYQFPDFFPAYKTSKEIITALFSLIIDDMLAKKDDFRLVMTLGLYTYSATKAAEILPVQPFVQYLQKILSKLCPAHPVSPDFLSFAADACISFLQITALQNPSDIRLRKAQLVRSLELFLEYGDK